MLADRTTLKSPPAEAHRFQRTSGYPDCREQMAVPAPHSDIGAHPVPAQPHCENFTNDYNGSNEQWPATAPACTCRAGMIASKHDENVAVVSRRPGLSRAPVQACSMLEVRRPGLRRARPDLDRRLKPRRVIERARLDERQIRHCRDEAHDR
jgi:hypothetical protein